MSEQKKRTLNDVQQEYVNLCTRAGDLQYKIQAFKKDLEVLNNQLRELNFEAVKIQQEEAAAKKAEESKPAAVEEVKQNG